VPDREGSDEYVEAPVFHTAGYGPCYVPHREGNTTYVNARESEYKFRE